MNENQSGQPGERQQAEQDANEDLELRGEQAEQVAGGVGKKKADDSAAGRLSKD